MSSLVGFKALQARLKILDDKVQRKIVKSAVGKALNVIKKNIKGEVPPQWKEIKKLIGSRFTKATGFRGVVAKAGAGVGISRARRKSLKQKGKDRSGRPGVGIGAENVHWFILGTKERRTGTTTRGRGAKAKHYRTKGVIRRTGRMPPQVPGIVRRGFRKSESAAKQALWDGLHDGIHKEVQKLNQALFDEMHAK